MGFGASLVLIVTGAVLTWAVTAEVAGVDGRVVGVILLIAGVAAFVLSWRLRSSWGGPMTIGRDRENDEPRRRP
jgi:Domain of unknown function (DUF6458)